MKIDREKLLELIQDLRSDIQDGPNSDYLQGYAQGIRVVEGIIRDWGSKYE